MPWMKFDEMRALIDALPTDELERLVRIGYFIGSQADGQQMIVCFKCKAVSSNPQDVAEKYCGKCHRFHEREREHAAMPPKPKRG